MKCVNKANPHRSSAKFHKQGKNSSGKDESPNVGKGRTNRSNDERQVKSPSSPSKWQKKKNSYSSSIRRSSSSVSNWRVIATSPSSRHLMRAVSGLGMEDPVLETKELKTISKLYPCRAMDDNGMHGDVRSTVSVASDPTADLQTGMDTALFKSCVGDLARLSSFSRAVLGRSFHLPARTKDGRTTDPPNSNCKNDARKNGRGIRCNSPLYRGLTLDDVLRGASAGRGIDGNVRTRGDRYNDPPKRAVRKSSFVEHNERDKAPHIAQRQASLKGILRNDICLDELNDQSMSTGVSESSSESSSQSPTRQESMGQLELQVVVKSSAMANSESADMPPKMAQRMQSGSPDELKEERGLGPLTPCFHESKQSESCKAPDETPRRVMEVAQRKEFVLSTSAGECHRREMVQAQTSRTSKTDPSSDEELIHEANDRTNARVKDRAAVTALAPREYRHCIQERPRQSIQERPPRRILNRALVGLFNPFKQSAPEEEALPELKNLSCQGDKTDDPSDDVMQVFTESMPEIYSDELSDFFDTPEVSLFNKNLEGTTKPILSTRKATVTRHCISAMCREKPRRASVLLNVSSGSQHIHNKPREELDPNIEEVHTELSPSLQAGRAFKRDSSLEGPRHSAIFHQRRREKLSSETSQRLKSQTENNNEPMRRPVRKDSPNTLSPVRAASSLNGPLELPLSSPPRDCIMGIPQRVESGDIRLYLNEKTTTSTILSSPDTPADEGESTVVINDTEITLSASVDEELSIPTYGSYLSADEELCEGRHGTQADGTCISAAESTIALNLTVDSDRDGSFLQAIHSSSNHAQSKAKKNNRRGGELTHESYRSTDSTVSFPMQRWDALNLTRHSELNAPSFHRTSTHHTALTRQTDSTIHMPGSNMNTTNHTTDSFGASSWITEESLASYRLDILEDFPPQYVEDAHFQT